MATNENKCDGCGKPENATPAPGKPRRMLYPHGTGTICNHCVGSAGLKTSRLPDGTMAVHGDARPAECVQAADPA